MQKQFRKLHCSEVAFTQERRKRRAHSCVLAHTDKTATDESEREIWRGDLGRSQKARFCQQIWTFAIMLWPDASHCFMCYLIKTWIFNGCFRVLLAAALYLSYSYRFWIVQIQKQGIEESWHLGWHCFPWAFSYILKIADWSSAGRSLNNVAKLMTEGRQKHLWKNETPPLSSLEGQKLPF